MPTSSRKKYDLAARLATGLLTALLAAGLVGGCGTQAPRPAAPRPQVKVQPKPQADTAAQQGNVYTYNATDKPDPFRPFGVGKVAQPAASELADGLGGIEIDQLKLVGVAQGPGGPMALVQDGAGRGYILTPGMVVGSERGVVKAIASSSVSVEEKTIDYAGRPRTKTVMIKMAQEE